jgi:hypothetical protein
MDYQLIQPPRVPLDFRAMSKQELKEYKAWFLGSIPERIAVLAAAVRATPGCEQWEPDGSPESLDALGEWFAAHVETRSRTPDEMERLTRELHSGYDPTDPKTQVVFHIEIADWTLTNRTVSLAMDLGMYMSQVFLKQHPTLKWIQQLTSVRSLDYGEVVLKGFYGGKMRWAPYGQTMGLARGLASGHYTGGHLREHYDSLSDSVRPGAEELARWAPGYRLIEPPGGLFFGGMTGKQLQAYGEWFHRSLPDRIRILAEAIRLTPGYERWEPDGSPESLPPLGKWYLEHVDTRSRSERDLKFLAMELRSGGYLDSRDPAGKIASLAMDVGMYLSQVLLRHHPSLQWAQRTRGRHLPDFGQPVLTGFIHRQWLNPFYAVIALAYGLAQEVAGADSLLGLCEHWSGVVEREPHGPV